MKITGGSVGSGPLWRVVQLIAKRRPFDPGPWHTDRKHADSWALWLRAMGHDTYVQSSTGEIYDGNRLIVKAAP